MKFTVLLVSLGLVSIISDRAYAVTIIGSGTPPLTISSPGSYRLDRNLTLANPNTSAIVITSGNVVLDLDGHAVTGPNSCTMTNNTVNTCTYNSGTHTGIGIDVQVIDQQNVTIKNGSINKMAYAGIHTLNVGFAAITVSDISVSFIGGYGMEIREGSIRNSSSNLSIVGLMCNGCSMSGITASGNKLGVEIYNGKLSEATATWNGHGIYAVGSLLNDVNAFANQIVSGSSGHGATVQQSTVVNFNAQDNAGSGLVVPSPSQAYIVNSGSFLNQGYGFLLHPTACFRNITAFDNLLGQINVGLIGGSLPGCSASR